MQLTGKVGPGQEAVEECCWQPKLQEGRWAKVSKVTCQYAYDLQYSTLLLQGV